MFLVAIKSSTELMMIVNIMYATLYKKIIIIIIIQPRKYQLSNSQVSDITKSVVRDKKLTAHNSHPSPQQSSRCNPNIEKVVHFFKIAKSYHTITLVCYIIF